MTARAVLFALSVLLPLAVSADDAPATERPVAYNLVPRATESAYSKIREVYGELYSIVDVQEGDPDLTPPTLSSVAQHLSTIGDQPPAGKATVVYVIGTDGTVLLPTLVDATDPTVGTALVESAARSRYTPARYRGEPVTTIGGQQLRVRLQRPASDTP